jgi:AraC family transcriptional regulator
VQNLAYGPYAALQQGQITWDGGSSTLATLDFNEGSFKFDDVTLGLILSHQPEHWARYGDSKTRKLPLAKGDMWIFAPGMDGFCQWRDPQTFLNLQISRSVFERAQIEVPDESIHHVAQADPLIQELMMSLHAAPSESPRIYRDSLTTALAVHVSTLTPRHETVKADTRIQRVISYIEDDLARDVSLDELAGVAAMSPFHFSRVFKQTTGASPYKFIIARRMERAKEMLKSSPAAVASIAMELGYSDVSRFTELFKRHIGTTPGAYRAN